MKATEPFSTNLGKDEFGCDNRRWICPTTRPEWKQPSRAGTMPITFVSGDQFADRIQARAVAHGCNYQGSMRRA